MAWKIYNNTLILCTIALGGLMLGLETTSMAVFLSSDIFMDYFDYPGPLLQGVISGSSPASAFFGCWLAGYISDLHGRIPCIKTASFLWCVGSFISVFTWELISLIVGRAIKGLSLGCFSAVLSVYLLEVMPIEKRGLSSSVIQWCLTWGILLMFYLSFLCDYSLQDDWSFRAAWSVESLPGVLLFIFSFFLPESPKWLAYRGRMDESRLIFQKLNSSVAPLQESHSPQITEDQNSISQGALTTRQQLDAVENIIDRFEAESQACSYLDLFRSALRYHLFAGILTQAAVQLSGIGILMYYMVFICEMIGMQGDTKIMAASLQYVINIIFTIPLIFLINKMRRKDILVYGTSCLGLCICAIGSVMGYFGHQVPPIGGNESVVWEVSGTAGSWTLALCFLFVAIFASTLSCVSWLYTNEIFPLRAKAKGSAICMSVSWILSFILTFLAPLSLSSIKWGTFIVFGGCGLISSLFMGVWFPETFGKDDYDIENIFGSTLSKDIESKGESHENKSVQNASTGSNKDCESEKISRQSTMRLQLDKTIKLSPPLNDSTTPAKSFTAQSSPFLKKMGAPFDVEEDDAHEEEGSSSGTPGYYNVSASSFLGGYQ
uniref:MFS transporter n=1 Tax=Cyberlindnera americana TaxID=36016 RepID=A0A5P8N8X2_9ASCO|nr:MFS transporter [Cyberlindnera americana]